MPGSEPDIFEQTHRVVRLLGAPQPLVARILLAVDVAHAGRDEALGVFVHERLIERLIGRCPPSRVDDERVSHDLPGGKADHAPVDAQQPRERGIGGKVAQEFPHAPLLRLRAGAVLVIAAGEVVENAHTSGRFCAVTRSNDQSGYRRWKWWMWLRCPLKRRPRKVTMSCAS